MGLYRRIKRYSTKNGDIVSKVNGRQCDICGEWLGGRDAQWWIKIPRKASVRYGAPAAGMIRYDVCDDCMAKLAVEIQLKKNRKDVDVEHD